MKIEDFKNKLSTEGKVEFTDTMAVIEANYEFTPTAFTNGKLQNNAGENSGSCKLFAFASLQKLSKEDTLACFGKYYTEEVLQDIEGTGHQNIRNFMATGFDGISFDGEALKTK